MMRFAISRNGGRPPKSGLANRKKATTPARPLQEPLMDDVDHDGTGDYDELGRLFASKDGPGSDAMSIMGKLDSKRASENRIKAGIMSELAVEYERVKKNNGIENTEQWLMVAVALKDFPTAAEICLGLNKFHDAEQYLVKSKMPEKDADSKVGDFCASKSFFSYAAEYYKRAGRFMEAGLLFSKLERHRAAALCYEKAGSNDLAVEANRIADGQSLHEIRQ